MEYIEKLSGELPESQRIFLLDYFKNAPEWIADACKMIRVPAGQIFIHEREPVAQIHILLEGRVRATDYRIDGISYDFFWFKAVEIFGAMEAVLENERYMTTLMTDTPCRFITVRRKEYMKWMKADAHALYIQSALMTGYLLEQARRERVYLLMQSSDRLCLFLIKEYREGHSGNEFLMPFTRQEIANATGMSVKTVNRSVKRLGQSGFLDIKAGKIWMNTEQFQRMNQMILKKTDIIQEVT